MSRIYCLILPLLWASTLDGHPMGNFSVNHYARLEVASPRSTFTYVIDFAEIPTFELLQEWKIDARNAPALQARAATHAKDWLTGVLVTGNGRKVTPLLHAVRPTIQSGAGGMPILRVAISASLDLRSGAVEYEDRNYPGRTGWKEIVIRGGSGARILTASPDGSDISQELTRYPTDMSIIPPQDLTASLEWRATLPVAAAPRRLQGVAPESTKASGAESRQRASSPGIATSQSVSRQFAAQQPIAPGTVVKGDFLSRMLQQHDLGIWLILAGIGVAFGLGAMHALSPGHGKTIVAAYLVGSRGALKHAVFLGATVTATHTLSVFLLGIGVLLFEEYIIPDRIIPWLGGISGLSIVGVGVALLYQRAKALLPTEAVHAHSHDAHVHPGHSGDHVHVHDHLHAVTSAPSHLDSEHSHDTVAAPAPTPHVHSHAERHVTLHTHDSESEHTHQHLHGESVHGHHGGRLHSHIPEDGITLGSLIALGISGGLVPCPSALVLMLSAIALGHAGLGLLLLVGFSLGLALVLMAIGALVIYTKHLIPDRHWIANHPFFRLVPVFSAVVVICLGLGMTAISLGWFLPARLGL